MIIFKYEGETSIPKHTANTGACVGDQIIWSSHNPQNIRLPGYLTANKLYEIIEVNAYGDAVVICNDGGKSSWNAGQYDVIVPGNKPAPTQPEFGKAIIEITTINDLKTMTKVLGGFADPKNGEGQTYQNWSAMKEVLDAFGLDYRH